MTCDRLVLAESSHSELLDFNDLSVRFWEKRTYPVTILSPSVQRSWQYVGAIDKPKMNHLPRICPEWTRFRAH